MVGYLNVALKDGRANIAPDPERAPLVRRAFELMASGLHSRADVLRMVTEEGLTTTREKRPVSPQTLHEILKKPVYCGWVSSPTMEDLRVKGLHEPIVSQELFDEVQDVLKGKRLRTPPKRKHNPNFPLKPFVKCEGCGTPLTGGFAKGKTKKYGHYWCRRAGCRAVKLSKEKLETEFIALLQKLRPNPETVSEFPKIAAQVWTQTQRETEKTLKKLTENLAEQKRLKSELLRAKLRSEVSQEDYQEANHQFVEEIAGIESKLRSAHSHKTRRFSVSPNFNSWTLQGLGSVPVMSNAKGFKLFCFRTVWCTPPSQKV